MREERVKKQTKRQSRWHTFAIMNLKERTCLMRETIQENGLQGKICEQIDLGLLQEVIAPSMIEDLLETYQMKEEREQKTNMVAMVYWLIALHLYPTLSQRRVYGKLVSGLDRKSTRLNSSHSQISY